MQKIVGKELSILMLSAVPVLLQFALKESEREPNIWQAVRDFLLVYGLVAVVRSIFRLGRVGFKGERKRRRRRHHRPEDGANAGSAKPVAN
jgi:hypothetical protein